MQIYLPVAELAVDIFVLLGLGAFVGFLSGLFGIGGGFLMTPFLIFIGVPPAVAVATQNNQSIASAISGMIAHWRKGNVDFQLGGVMLACGLVGSLLGVWLFGILKKIGQLDLVINVSYSLFLTFIGLMMLIESIRTYFKNKKPEFQEIPQKPNFLQRMPLKTYFPRSQVEVSLVGLFLVGFVLGTISSVMGLFSVIMVPILFYLVRMPGQFVPGTSLFQNIFIASTITFLQAVNYNTVDVMLALFLILGSIIGAPIGGYLCSFIKGEYLRVLLALLLLSVSSKLIYEMAIHPPSFYSISDIVEENS
jgi:uncharacterized protein